MKIESGRIINNLIEPNKRQYSIPVYQRNYEWANEQCEKLFADIVEAHRQDKEHFCGSIVFSRLKDEHNIDYFVIIDGQQRLTTIYLLIKALMDSTDLPHEKDSFSSVLYNVDKFDKYDWDEASKLKLKPIKTDNIQLKLLMENKFDQIDKSSDIYRNYELFKKLIQKALADDPKLSVPGIYDGIEHLTCAIIKLENDDAPQEVFERINSTGLPLSLSDKIRNFVLMTDVDQEVLYENYWLPIEENVKRDKMSDFFLNYLNLELESSVREKSAYDSFKNYYRDNHYTNQSMLSELKHYSELYKVFQGGQDAKNRFTPKVAALLSDLYTLKQTTIYVFLFRVFDDFLSDLIDDDTLEKILEFFVNYSVRRLVCEIGSNSLRGLYISLYRRIFGQQKHKEHYFDAIVCFFTQLNTGDKFPTDPEFKVALREKDLYHKMGLRKYLLAAIENKDKHEQVLIDDDITIEHVMPQKLSSAWQKMIGENWQSDQAEYLHTLGNLTLTGYNSELSNKPFSEKKQLLNEYASKFKILNADILDKDAWTVKTIKARAQRLSDYVLKLYQYPNTSVEISFKDPNYKEYTCEDPEEATNKSIEYFILQGEKIYTTTFAEMLRIVVKKLYDEDPNIIENLARQDSMLFEWARNRVIFSYDPEKVVGGKLIEGSDIYFSDDFSASRIINIIRILLEKYGIDPNEVIYSARHTKKHD